MASDGECSIRQDWHDQDLLYTNQEKVEHENENFCDNGAHYGQTKEQLEEELTRWTLIMSEKKLLLREMQKSCQKADDELRLALTCLKADLQQEHNDSMLKQIINWEVLEQRIIRTLIEVGECQQKLRSIKLTNLIPIFKVLIQTLRGQETKWSPKTCYHCHKEGHLKRNCPERINKGWPSQPFKQKIALRHKQKVDEVYRATSVSWTGEEGNDEDVITTGQNSRKNVKVS